MKRDPFASRRCVHRQPLVFRFSEPPLIAPSGTFPAMPAQTAAAAFGNVTAAQWLQTFKAGTA